jgi:predicted protein tyrosine phosphatase
MLSSRRMSELSKKPKVLFVCRQNKVRSLTAEHLYRVRPDLEVRSAGTVTFAKNQLTKELMNWADAVFVFDESQVEAMEKRFGTKEFGRPVICLGLPDNFDYKSQQLVLKLTAKLEPYLGRPTAKPAKTRLPAIKSLTTTKRDSANNGAARRSFVSRLLTTVGMTQKKPQPAE